MIALTKEKREELNTFINASIEQRCTVYTLKKQRELEELRDQIALASLKTETFCWPNGCNDSIPNALRYLAENDRPSSGNSSFNTEHLYDMARQFEIATSNRFFTAPPVPEINIPHELMDLVNAVDFYNAVKAENPATETGMWRDAYDWIKKAAVEAAPVIKRLHGLGE